MKPSRFTLLLALIVGLIPMASLNAADAKPAISYSLAEPPLVSPDIMISAARRLAEAPNYSWISVQKNSSNGNSSSMTVVGMTERNGVTVTKPTTSQQNALNVTIRSFGPTESVWRDGRSVGLREGKWLTPREISAEMERGMAARGGTNIVRGGTPPTGDEFIKNPATLSEDLLALAGDVKERQSVNGVFTGRLTDQAVIRRLGTARDRDGTPIIPVNTSSAVKLWLKDGVIEKYEVTVKGTLKLAGNQIHRERTDSTEVKNISTTTVVIPPAATAKLESVAAAKPAK
jgi:hypothetical protein